jgi:uncharacterized membrane protein YvbJ
MGSDEVCEKCPQCGTELKQSDKMCPECGFTTKMHLDRKAVALLGLKAIGGKEHAAVWSSTSYAILFGIISVVLFLLYLAYELLPLSSGLKVTVVIVSLVVLGVISYWKRYAILMFIRWLDHKLTARKTSRTK